MYFLLNMVILQPAMFLYQRVYTFHVLFIEGNPEMNQLVDCFTEISAYTQWLVLVPVKGGRWHIIP